jgi:hypothetical protein
MTLNGKRLELCFLPEQQALPYVIGMELQRFTDILKGEKLIAIFL